MSLEAHDSFQTSALLQCHPSIVRQPRASYYYYYYYYTQSVVVSCSSLFCESGQQLVVKGLTGSCTVILTIMLFCFSIQVPISISLLSPIKLFFVHVLLSSQSQLLQYTSQSQLILHLMPLKLLGLQSLLSCPTFLQSHL